MPLSNKEREKTLAKIKATQEANAKKGYVVPDLAQMSDDALNAHLKAEDKKKP